MEYNNKVIVNFSYEEFGYPLLFMLSLTLLGLECPLGYFFIMAMLFYSFKNNRYDFLIQCTMLFGAFRYYDDDIAFPFKLADGALIICLASTLLYRKDKTLRYLLGLTFLYFLFLFAIAYVSDETISTQLRRLRLYMHIIYFMFPLLVFSGKKFEIEKLFNQLFIYVFIISIFIILDSVVLSSHVFLPRAVYGDLTYTTLEIAPFSTYYRVYPQPIFISALLLYPTMRYCKLPTWYWFGVAGGLLCTKTISIMGGFIITWVLFTGSWKLKLKSLIIVISTLYVGNIVDEKLGGALRINQLLEQFSIFSQGNQVLDDMESLAEFGSGRGAQIIPKLELLTSTDKQLFGFGFLHDKLTTNEEYIINNQYYIDQSKAEEVASLVEVTQIQTILDMGFIGFIVQHVFYFLIYLIIRKYKYSSYYAMTLVCISLFGVGGFAGLISHYGLLPLGLVLGSVLLINKNVDYETVNSNSRI